MRTCEWPEVSACAIGGGGRGGVLTIIQGRSRIDHRDGGGICWLLIGPMVERVVRCNSFESTRRVHRGIPPYLKSAELSGRVGCDRFGFLALVFFFDGKANTIFSEG